VRFDLLGPLEVSNAEEPVPAGGLNQRAILAYLLLHANRTVATSQLVRAVWGEDAPPTARKMLQAAIAGLRELLATDTGQNHPVLVTRAPGYLLRINPQDIDLHRFQHLLASGRAALADRSWDAAAVALRAAWRLWRGPVVADLAEAGIDWPELAVVRSSRLAAFEDHMDAELAVGRHHEVLGELEAAVAEEPMRERLCSNLMLALYRCGRQADALEFYRGYRDMLVDLLGLEPAPGLRGLQEAILNHESYLLDPRRSVG
jgi:DNA-binding SARP family transcriptional activator